MKKRMLYSILAIIIIIAILFSTYKLMNSRTYQLFGSITHEVNTKGKVVALTFDDGPSKQVEGLLSVLKKYNAKATFFLIGNDIVKFPDEAKKIVEAGHQIGNHTYSHNRMVFKSPSFIKEEIEKTDKLIREAGYKGEIDFRPPNGKKLIGLPYYLNKHNRETITWGLEPDSYYTSAADKANYVKENIKNGSIILMHPMYDETGEELKAVEQIVKELSAEGYQFVTVDELQSMER